MPRKESDRQITLGLFSECTNLPVSQRASLLISYLPSSLPHTTKLGGRARGHSCLVRNAGKTFNAVTQIQGWAAGFNTGNREELSSTQAGVAWVLLSFSLFPVSNPSAPLLILNGNEINPKIVYRVGP